MVMETCYLIPFWFVVVLGLRSLFNIYTAILIASVLSGAVEILKAKSVDNTRWQKITKDITVVGHRACAENAPENTLAG